jgi:type II secretory pathway component PulF
MPTYTYQGMSASGKKVAGEISAEDTTTAFARVKALGVYPTDVKVAHQASTKQKPIVSISGGVKVSSSELTIFSRQLANLVKGGLPLMRTFSALTEHTENPRFRAVLERMQQEIKGGKSLHEALDMYPTIFPPLYVSMVKAGEASGQISPVLNWLAGYLEKEQAWRNQIRSALAYPILLVCMGILTVSGMILFIVPRFVSMFEEFGQALPLPTVILIGVSTFVGHWWWTVVLAGVVIGVGGRAYGRTPEGRLRYDQIKLKLPLFGKLNLKSAVSKFARTTATLLYGGVTLFDAMGIVRDVVGNEVLVRGADHVRDGLREGESFAGRMRASGAFPPLLTNMAAVGEEIGDLQGVLITISDAYDVEVEASLKSMVSLLEPVIIVLMGSMIAFIILAMLLPILTLNPTG